MRSSTIGTVAWLAPATCCFGQAFNVDFGARLAPPGPGYAGAASQPGHWQFVETFAHGDPVLLEDTSGQATAVRVNASLPIGPAYFDNPETTGDDEALLDDYFDLHSTPVKLTITGLAAGWYEVYVYAWGPDNPHFKTFVGINGIDQGQVGGSWTGALRENVTHARQRLLLDGDDRVFLNFFGLGAGTLNGLQIKPIPAPSALVVLAAGLIVRRGRRG